MSEVTQYIDGLELRCKELQAEIEHLKFLNAEEQATIGELAKLCTRAADALTAVYHEWPVLGPPDSLIDELRKAAQ